MDAFLLSLGVIFLAELGDKEPVDDDRQDAAVAGGRPVIDMDGGHERVSVVGTLIR